MVDELRARRDLVVAGLNGLPGVSCRTPRGAFYAFPNVAAVPLDADALATRLLDEAGVAVLAGSAFGRPAPATCACPTRRRGTTSAAPSTGWALPGRAGRPLARRARRARLGHR